MSQLGFLGWYIHLYKVIVITYSFSIVFQEGILLEPMFNIPGSNIGAVQITEDVILNGNAPVYIERESSIESEEYEKEEAVNS